MCIVPQAYECILNGYNGIIITSNPSDVFALVFFYIPRFFRKSLIKLWLKFRTAATTGYLPMHIFCMKLGHKMYSVVIKAHILACSNATSKIGKYYLKWII